MLITLTSAADFLNSKLVDEGDVSCDKMSIKSSGPGSFPNKLLICVESIVDESPVYPDSRQTNWDTFLFKDEVFIEE
jgi:hypothetical protein